MEGSAPADGLDLGRSVPIAPPRSERRAVSPAPLLPPFERSPGTSEFPGSPTRKKAMDFLLECIGFPPDEDLDRLAARIRREGEPVPYRGPAGEHLKVRLPGRVELRLDREEGEDHDQVFPYYDVPRRLRFQVDHLASIPDSPFDVLAVGTANPPLPDEEGLERFEREDYPFVTYLTDARRLPGRVPKGHVLAVSVAGFALDVHRIGPDEGPTLPRIVEEPRGTPLVPLGGPDDPAGVVDLSLRVAKVRRVENAWSGHGFVVLELDAPGRPLDVFVSPWQLEADGVPPPRRGWRVEGTFLFTGRVSGGLPPLAGRTFG